MREVARAGVRFLVGSGRDCGAGRERRGREGQAEGGDHPQQGRDPDDPRRRLQEPRLRLRLRVRRGQHLHDRRAYVTVARRALALLRPRRRLAATAPTRTSTTDLFYQRIKNTGDGRRAARRAAAGRAEEGGPQASRATSPATTATSTRPASTTSRTRPATAQPWVREDHQIDAYRRFYQLGQLASRAGRRWTGSSTPRRRAAAPRAPATPSRRKRRCRRARRGARRSRATSARTRWGLGSEATENGSGMVLGNPHFPWHGLRALLPVAPRDPRQAQRLRRQPLRRAGGPDRPHQAPRLDATRSRPRSVSCRSSSRSCPGDPTSYLVDGKPEKMEATRSRCRRCSPTARSRRDADALHDPLRADDHTRCRASRSSPGRTRRPSRCTTPTPTTSATSTTSSTTNRAQSTNELLDVLEEVRGHPVGQHDRRRLARQGLYADIGAIPNVPNAKATGAADARSARATFPALGLPILDGSRSACALGTDPDAVVPGIFGPSNLPNMFRRRLRRQLQRLLLAREPRAAARPASRGSSATRARERSLRDAARADDDRAAARRAATASRATSSTSTSCGGSSPTTACTRGELFRSTSSRPSATRTRRWPTPTAPRST